MKESNLYKELRRHATKTLAITLLLFTMSALLLLSSFYITTDINIEDKYKDVIDITTMILIVISVYISYINYKLRENMFMLYHAYNLTNDKEAKRRILLKLEAMFVIYDLNKLRELVREEYMNNFNESSTDEKPTRDKLWTQY